MEREDEEEFEGVVVVEEEEVEEGGQEQKVADVEWEEELFDRLIRSRAHRWRLQITRLGH